MPWFRLYAEARTDAKLRLLSDAEFRVWFNLLCYASEPEGDDRGSVDGSDLEYLAIEVASGDTDLLTTTIAKLKQRRILADEDGGRLRFVSFAKRQQRSPKPSDQPERVRQRVQAYRERARNAPPPDPSFIVTPGNAPVSPRNAPGNAPDRDIERDLEADRERDLPRRSRDKETRSTTEEAADAAAPPPKNLLLQVTKLPGWPAESEQRTCERLQAWMVAYPELDVGDEIRRATLWLEGKPKGKSNLPMFLENWFKKAMSPPEWEKEQRNGRATQAVGAGARRADDPDIGDSWVRAQHGS